MLFHVPGILQLSKQVLLAARSTQRCCSSSLGRIPVVMGTNFVQRFNPTMNKFEWTTQSDDYDFYQEIARSGYADMLHDFDRVRGTTEKANKKYEQALALAIKETHRKGRKAVVLDIGTGTGLLSMMAVRHGADKVYACEAFEPMAKCAARVLRRNKCDSKIKLIPKRSTELEVGEGKDLETRANILVTEVFDTELIGEGAIATFNHAHQFLLSEDSYVVPHAAQIFAMAVDCPRVDDWNKVRPFKLPDGSEVMFPPAIASCNGVPSVHDLQLSQLKPSLFTQLSSPQLVFEFNYTEHEKRTPSCRSSVVYFESQENGKCNAVFTWWILKMDREGEIIVTMQPEWWDPDNPRIRPTWKDHWMQCLYYLPEPCAAVKGQQLMFEAYHDEYSLWYAVKPSNRKSPKLNCEENNLKRPICECGVHTIISRNRLGMLNDDNRNIKYVSVLQNLIVPGQSICLVLSESSLLPLIAAKLGAKKVFVVEDHLHSARVSESFARFNGVHEIVSVINKNIEDIGAEDLDFMKIDVVIGEPYFHSAIHSWHNLYFCHAKEQMRWSYADDVKIVPSKAYLKGIAVQFQDLHLIKSPVGRLPSLESENKELDYGYDIQDFDNLILKASDLADLRIDAQPLWEYKGTKLSNEFLLAEFDMTQSELIVKHVPLEYQKFLSVPNGIALWMDWELDNGIQVGNGPATGERSEDILGSVLNCDMNSTQGVFFTHSQKADSTENIHVHYNVKSGDVEFSLVFPEC